MPDKNHQKDQRSGSVNTRAGGGGGRVVTSDS